MAQGRQRITLLENPDIHMGAINEMQADDGGLIKPRPSQPKKKKMIRARKGADASQGLSGGPSMMSAATSNQEGGSGGSVAGTEVRERRQLCEQILINGYVQSFVDFFYLTHRPDPKAAMMNTGGEDAAAEIEIDVSPQEMVFISKHLTTAEKARRLGDTNVVYQSFNVLAQYFQQLEDPKTGVYFYEKCLEIARLTNDRGAEMLANHCLGVVYESMGELLSAAAYHERHRDLAVEDQLDSEAATANAELVKIYWKFAEQKEAEKDNELSVQFYEKCLQAAQAAEDRASEGVASFKLGRVFISEGQAQQAIPFLEDYLQIVQSLDDLEGQGHAFSALALAYQALDDDSTAQQFLEQFLDVTMKTDNLMAQGEACKSLGALYSRQEEFHKAVEVFEKYFEITRSIVNTGQGSTPLVDLARTYLGIAKANAMLGRYYHAIKDDLGELLEWKNRRKDPQGL
mmetsp:Transcript_31348/g.40185  ORF Transcript_31348/g.40185 Transcript_31348/m.40185 type:complete len:458 (-) Transcript_31348:196-1569(-)